VSGIRLHAFHGVLPQERLKGNDYTVSVRVRFDVGHAAETDDVRDTLDYSVISEIVGEEMAKPSQLVENAAARVGERLFERFPRIDALDIKVTKHNPPMSCECAGAGVELHLTNHKTK